MKAPIVTDDVDRLIHVIRGRRIMLDRDLAKMYGVSTARLNQQVSRNKARFPDDFMFQLTKSEMENWMLQFATSNSQVKMGLRKPPYAFTEHGALAAAFVLNSPIAVGASIQIVRAFNRLRQIVTSHKELAVALAALERKVAGHDEHIQALFDAIHEIMEPPAAPRKEICFLTESRMPEQTAMSHK